MAEKAQRFKVSIPKVKSVASSQKIKAAVRESNRPRRRNEIKAALPMARSSSRLSVFINCPFDPEFQPFLRAILFTVCAMGCQPRSALEESDSSTLRLDKIYPKMVMLRC
jgi:hypothetical protein